MKIAVLYRALDPRFVKNFAQDVDGREDDSYHVSIVDALCESGHDAFGFCVREDHLQELLELDCDLAFNLVDDGLNNNPAFEPHLPAILDVFGIPYTGGDFLSIATTLDKARTKEILGFYKVRTPAFQTFAAADEHLRSGLSFPLIVKPLHEDASIGISLDSVVADESALRRKVAQVVQLHDQPAIAEEFIDGRELSVGVIEQGSQRIVTPVNEVVFDLPPGVPRIYSYIGKWDWESDEYKAIIPDQCPALELPADAEEQIRRDALQVFDVLRLRGYARVDFRLRSDSALYVLEVNANPLIGEYSVMATMAEQMGWSFSAFINALVIEAHRRFQSENRAMTLRSLRSVNDDKPGKSGAAPKSR